jgi:hypothetical protein
MTTSHSRVARGVPAGGQFAATVHAEPSFNLSLNDSSAGQPAPSPAEAPVLTPEQAGRLRSNKTPLRNAMARRGVTGLPSMKETNERIRSIQGRLNGRA